MLAASLDKRMRPAAGIGQVSGELLAQLPAQPLRRPAGAGSHPFPDIGFEAGRGHVAVRGGSDDAAHPERSRRQRRPLGPLPRAKLRPVAGRWRRDRRCEAALAQGHIRDPEPLRQYPHRDRPDEVIHLLAGMNRLHGEVSNAPAQDPKVHPKKQELL